MPLISFRSDIRSLHDSRLPRLMVYFDWMRGMDMPRIELLKDQNTGKRYRSLQEGVLYYHYVCFEFGIGSLGYTIEFRYNPFIYIEKTVREYSKILKRDKEYKKFEPAPVPAGFIEKKKPRIE